MMEMVGNAVAEAVAETLEALAFMDAMPISDDAKPDYSDSSYWSSLTLDEPFHGKMLVVMPVTLVKSILRVVFDEQPDSLSSGEVLRDIMGELVNTLAGNVLKRLVPEDQSFKIGLPETGEGCKALSDLDTFLFHVDDEVFSVSLVVSE